MPTPSFSLGVRQELSQHAPESFCCQQTLLASLFHHGRVTYWPHQILFTVEEGAIARLCFQLLKSVKWGDVHFQKPATGPLHRRHLYTLSIEDAAAQWRLLELEKAVLSRLKKRCCRRSWIRGAFLQIGSLVDPQKSYHLEFEAEQPAIERLQELLGREELYTKAYHRAGAEGLLTLYVKSSEEISHFLALVGAHHAMIALEEIRVERDLKNQVHRRVNCETANLNKTVDTAMRQAKEIAWLEKSGLIPTLPDGLREMAEVRLGNPYASLQELVDHFEKPITKSGVNHRLRRLHDMIVTELKKRGETLE